MMSLLSRSGEDNNNKRRKNDNAQLLLFDPPPRSDWTLISQGAEARVWKINYSYDPKTDTSGVVTDDTAVQTNGGHNNNNDDETTTGINTTTTTTTTTTITTTNNNSFIVCKERFSKTYRHPDLDAQLTKSRCRSEAKILEKCATKSTIRVPTVLRLDPPNLFLEYLDDDTLKVFLRRQAENEIEEDDDDVVVGKEDDGDEDETRVNDGDENKVVNDERVDVGKGPNKKMKGEQQPIPLKDLAHSMGELVGRLHNIGVIHGDLTTSNMILLRHKETKRGQQQHQRENSTKSDSTFELALIDFGLAKSTTSIEDQAVDLYVLERALQSTHPNLPASFFEVFLKAYSLTTTTSTSTDSMDGKSSSMAASKSKSTQSTIQRLDQVRQRGRKRECFG